MNCDAGQAVAGDQTVQLYACTLKDGGWPQAVLMVGAGDQLYQAEGLPGMLAVLTQAIDQLRDFLEHGNVANAVNFPAVSMARESSYRVAIANANVPNMLGQISTAMARAGLNIHNMVNKSRGDMAYTLVDVDSAVSDSVLADIASIDGVLSARYLPHEAG